MRRTILVVVVIAGITVGLTVAAPDPSSRAATQVRVFEYPGPFFRFVEVPNGPGDVRLQMWRLLDPVDETVVGQSITKITIVRVYKKGEDFALFFDSTVRLAEGDIAFYGGIRVSEFVDADGGELPVVGGTGAYAGATGAVTIEPARLAGVDGFMWTFNLITP